MKTHHVSSYVLVALGTLLGAIVLVTQGAALVLLLPLALIVGPPIFIVMTGRARTDRSVK